MRYDPTTRHYVARRTAEGRTKMEIIRCLKRPGRELGPRIDQVVGLGERADRAAGVETSPDPLAPGNQQPEALLTV